MFKGLVVSLILLAATVAQAAPTVELQLDLNASNGTWQVLATASPASISGAVYVNDNAGISGFAIDMKNILTGAMAGPNGLDLNAGTKRGFTQAGTTAAGASELEVFGGQNTTDATTLIYGIGQTGGSLTGLPPAHPDTFWSSPVLLASGTYTVGGNPSIDPNSSVTVFRSATDVTTSAAGLNILPTVSVPEPMTLSLLGLSALALLRRRR